MHNLVWAADSYSATQDNSPFMETNNGIYSELFVSTIYPRIYFATIHLHMILPTVFYHLRYSLTYYTSRRGSAASRLLVLQDRISPGVLMSDSSECCALSGRGFCDGLITRPEASYRMWCVWVWSWSVGNEETMALFGLLYHNKKGYTSLISSMFSTSGIHSIHQFLL